MPRYSALIPVGLGLGLLAIVLFLVVDTASAVGTAAGVAGVGLLVIGIVRTALGLHRRPPR